MRTQLRHLGFVGTTLLTVGCLKLQQTEKSEPEACVACHGEVARAGTPLDRAAPPRDLDGSRSTSRSGVGAHERHLFGQGHAKVACTDCHVVPETVFAKGHVDTVAPAEVILSGLASQATREPSYDSETGSCANTYCHGNAKVNWADARSEKDACGTCHGLPPALPHPQVAQCSECHGDVIAKDGTWRKAERHVDGRVDVAFSGGCAVCHGTDPETGAPPPDLKGNTESTALGVGAHVHHLKDSETHRGIACSECHRVPDAADSEGHIDDDGHAEIVFGTLAETDQHLPTYLAAQGTCSNTYCHGEASGNWQAPRNAVDACGSCHSLPPPLPHAQLTTCSNCHGRVVDQNQRIIEPSLHVNGKVEVDFGEDCSVCHGTGPAGAPPPDLRGNTAVSERGVGAHASHLVASGTHAAVACSECHAVPSVVADPGHLDGEDRAEVKFGSVAKSNGAQPTYDPAASTCSNTYCHRIAVVDWRAPRTSDLACGSCHALPPAAPHPNVQDCSLCHGAVIDASRLFVSPALHVDGTVQVVQNCLVCHGSGSNAAPPVDTNGNSATTFLSVGAHQVHVSGGRFSRPLDCQECHVVPTTIEAPGHLDVGARDPADVRFVGPALTMGRSVRWERASATCAGSYCHGPEDQTNLSPAWTASGSNLDCSSCHGMPPAPPHSADIRCSRCHSDVDASGVIIDRNLHINGEIDL